VEGEGVRATEEFTRPVGGRAVVLDIVDYLRASSEVTSIVATVRGGGSTWGPVDLLEPTASISEFERVLRNNHHLRREVSLRGSFSDTTLDAVELSIGRLFTHCSIAGNGRRSVAGERQVLEDILATRRRLLSWANCLIVTLAAAVTLLGFVLVHRL